MQSGDKAYIDSFNGLIACQVLEFVPAGDTTLVHYPASYRVKVTAKTGRGFVRGEIVTRPVSAIVGRSRVYVRGGQYRISAEVPSAVKVSFVGEKSALWYHV